MKCNFIDLPGKAKSSDLYEKNSRPFTREFTDLLDLHVVLCPFIVATDSNFNQSIIM